MYFGGDVEARDNAQVTWKAQAEKAGVSLDFSVPTQWQPIAAQRVMMLASKSGVQEKYIEALNRKHFMEAQSASRSETVLDAAEEAGLDRAMVRKFLEGDEYTAEVWESYRATIEDMHIHSIPLFSFSLPGHDRGHPFGSGSKAWRIHGAQETNSFLNLFRAAVEAAKQLGELKA
mmetsp:Transcript_35190/g.64258  ORF Transcript_35190/g.64258 Transcript_35190/m.64258 type:complete len:175 (-) Transcript_35190:74-598(-)